MHITFINQRNHIFYTNETYIKFKINFHSIYVLKEERKQTESFISNNFNNHCKTHFNFQKDKDIIVV